MIKGSWEGLEVNKKEKLAFAVVAALAMTSGGFALGQSSNSVSSDQVIYACVTGVNGNITKVSNTPKICPKGTTPISWNMIGPKGDVGPQGPRGAEGPAGSQTQSSNVPQTYVVSPSGTKYPVFNGISGVSVKVNSLIYSFGQEFPLGAFDSDKYFNDGNSVLNYFTSSDCSSTPLKIKYSPLEMPKGTVYTYAGFGTSNWSAAFVAKEAPETSISQIKSIRVNPTLDGCIEIRQTEYKEKLLSFYSFVKNALKDTLRKQPISDQSFFSASLDSCQIDAESVNLDGSTYSLHTTVDNCTPYEFSNVNYSALGFPYAGVGGNPNAELMDSIDRSVAAANAASTKKLYEVVLVPSSLTGDFSGWTLLTE